MIPTSSVNTIDLYFLDARAKLLDIAAFMDRTERAGVTEDFRYRAFRNALRCLDGENRAERILVALSDPTDELIPQATTNFARGAWRTEGNTSGSP